MMELKAIESSRVVFLTSVHRPAGQLFMPSAAAMLVNRYHFQKIPGPDDGADGILKFDQGVYNNVGINELAIFPDGLVVTTRAYTNVIDEFIDDLMAWAKHELGIQETGIPPRERHYESTLIVNMSVGSRWNIPYIDHINSSLKRYQSEYGLRDFDFTFGGFSSIVDSTVYAGRKPIAFSVVRRINVPIDADIFYSTAPLKTEDHLALLSDLERRMS
ncbi:MAG: hypothetical protein ACT4O2_02125 [Beijerinckiaceae bacterium]